MKTQDFPIDFVVLWVDGSDPKWLAKKKRYKPEIDIADEESRYRDWGIFKYWFRAVEEYAPWVNHIYLVTDNQKPEWINDKCSKLTIVDHREIIDGKYLPTFNSQAIEMNLHNIPGLSEHFVYFNDDMYLGRPVKPSDFFDGSRIVESAILNSGTGMDGNELFAKTMFNDILLINRNFNKKEVVNKHIGKWLSVQYGKHNIRTLSQIIYPYFTGYKPTHSPAPFLKSTFEEIWQKEKDEVEKTTSHKFRHCEDVNQYIFSLWEICKNNFKPKSVNRTRYIQVDRSNYMEAIKMIQSERYNTFCLNDGIDTKEDSEIIIPKIKRAFAEVLGEKSGYEK